VYSGHERFSALLVTGAGFETLVGEGSLIQVTCAFFYLDVILHAKCTFGYVFSGFRSWRTPACVGAHFFSPPLLEAPSVLKPSLAEPMWRRRFDAGIRWSRRLLAWETPGRSRPFAWETSNRSHDWCGQKTKRQGQFNPPDSFKGYGVILYESTKVAQNII